MDGPKKENSSFWNYIKIQYKRDVGVCFLRTKKSESQVTGEKRNGTKSANRSTRSTNSRGVKMKRDAKRAERDLVCELK